MNRSLAWSAFQLTLVLAALGGAAWWWSGQLQPDFLVDRALRLQPVSVPKPPVLVPLEGGTRQAWPLAAGRPGARFEFTVPGDGARLRFAEATLQGLPDVSVRVTHADGRLEEAGLVHATEAAWAVRGVPLPVQAGERIALEIAATDGRGRPDLGQVLLADVVLESAGRPVDESQTLIPVASLVADLLAGSAVEQVTAPPTAESARAGLPGPRGLLLPPTLPRELLLERVPEDCTLELVLHAARTGVGPMGPARVRITLGDDTEPAADVRVDEAADPPGAETPWHELLLSFDLAAYTGQTLPVRLQRSGGDNLAVLVVEASVVRRSAAPRRAFDPEHGVNLLLVVVEGLRSDRLGAFGYKRGHTPNIDALARQGITYTRVMAQSSWGLPNLASLVTGLSPVAHGVGMAPGRVLSPRITTLARSAGWAGLMSAAFHSTREVTTDAGLFEGYGLVHRQAVDAPVLVEAAVDWLADAQQFQWFLTLVLSDPLAPYEPARQDLAVLPPGLEPGLLARLRVLDSRPGAAEAMAQQLGLFYDAEVARVDRALGVLLDELEARGLRERTVVAVVGTHGQEFQEHGGGAQGQTLFDEVVHVPVIVAGPGVVRPEDAPVVVSQPVALADVTHLVGHVGRVLSTGSIPDRVPAPFGPDRPGLTLHAVLAPYPEVTARHLAATRRDEWLLLQDLDTDRRWLFDHTQDPGEQADRLAGAAAGPDVIALSQEEALLAAWRDWYAEQIASAPAHARRVPLR